MQSFKKIHSNYTRVAKWWIFWKFCTLFKNLASTPSSLESALFNTMFWISNHWNTSPPDVDLTTKILNSIKTGN